MKLEEQYQLIEFADLGDERGNLVVIEGEGRDIPFDIKRVFYIYGSDGEVYSYVYDKIVNNVMDVDYAKAWTSLEDDAIVEALTAYLAADQKWISFNVDGFYVDADEKPAYLLATKVRQEGAEDWVYVYVLKDGQILGNFSGVMEESNK